MFLIDNLANILKDIFFTNLFTAEKECNNLENNINNIKKYVIDFVDRQIIKNKNIINQINQGL